ncbi:hypothetical protein Ndes2526B_g05382 [Nannochloris sp. 'desiccata']
MESDRDSCGVSGTERERSTDIFRRSATPSLPAAAKNATYIRPTTQRAARRRAPPHSKDRFEAEVLGGKLWHRACQEISRDDFNGEIPMEFPSIDEYIATLDPLVLEEAREGLKADWSENCTAGRTWRVEILSVDERTEGWSHVRVKIQGGREQDALHVFNSNNTAVVLTLGRPPQRAPTEWITSHGNGGGGNKTITNKRGKLSEGDGCALGKAARPVKRSRVDQLKEQEGGSSGGVEREGTPLSATPTPTASELGDAGEEDDVGDIKNSVSAKVVAGLTIRGGGGGGYGKYNNNQSGASGRGGGGQEFTIKIHPCCCPSHASNASAPCTGIVNSLRRFTSAWWMTPAGMLVTSEREFDAVHAVRSVDSDLMRHVLKPKLLAEIGKYYANDDLRRRMWPEQARHPAFIKYLKSQYDYKQLEAIEMAACHLGDGGGGGGGGSASMPSSSKPSSLTTSAQERRSVGQPSTSRVGPLTEKEHKKDQPQRMPLPSLSPPPKLSFVLIQGPPGTGKTHTVRGVLNVWHLVAFQRYYESMVQHVLPHGVQRGAYSTHAATAGSDARSNSTHLTQSQQFDMLRKVGEISKNNNSKNSTSAHLGATFAATKPRILICTPSNAACDELMARVMALGFCDGSGTIYRPNIVRAGADDSVVAPAVRERSLRSLVARYRDMSQPEWQRRCADTAAKMALAEQEVAALEASLERCRPGQEATSTARRLVDRVQAAHRLRREVERLEAARDLVWGTGGTGGGGGGGRGDNNQASHRAESELEALLLSEAEMVFATLSSTQRKVFKSVAAKYPFRTVLIDEAGQSSEVAALQPLAFGAKQVVLVGDPQQLPATILSEAAKSVMMERSLFERLQAQGCPVVLLTVQYRMHPEIRSFPSRHFYENKLEDAPSVIELPPEAYHSNALFKPYAVFDVARGKEQRRQGAGGSLSNVAEAELAACMYASLRSYLLERHKKACATSTTNGVPLPSPPTKVSVAVITPYREQRAVLRQTFISICGSADVLKEVAIETVDSYQGRQVDIVILSCVRAGASGGLGFVNDIRRLNVAITRARRSLWILGSVATLRSNVEWSALIDDAEERGVVVHDAHAEDLFPDLAYWQRKEDITYGGGGGGGGGGGDKTEKGGKKRQHQKQQSIIDSAGAYGAAVVPSDSKKQLPREEEEDVKLQGRRGGGRGRAAAAAAAEKEAEKELEIVRRREGRASDGSNRPATAARLRGGGGGRGGGREGGIAAPAGRGRRSNNKRERSISPQPETTTSEAPAPAAAEPSSKYPKMPTRR